jgi:hypothetical protein
MEISGRGLYDVIEVGVLMERSGCSSGGDGGGHSCSGGNWGSVSFWLEEAGGESESESLGSLTLSLG